MIARGMVLKDIDPRYTNSMNESFPQTSPEVSQQSAEFSPDFHVETFTAGKKPPRNEDVVAVGANYLVIADAATD